MAALFASVAVACALAYAMRNSRLVERLTLPIIDVLQSIPILAFFPVALHAIVRLAPVAGVELAVMFLIFTCTAWNIILGVYQSFKTIPREYVEMSRAYLRDKRLELAHVLIPAALCSVYYNIPVSWANAFFFITSSEVIALGASEHRVFGIGSLVMSAYMSGDELTMALGIVVGSAFNFALYALLWSRLVKELPPLPARVAGALAAWTSHGSLLSAALILILFIALVYCAVSPLLGAAPGVAAAYLMYSIDALAASLLRVMLVLLLCLAIGLLVLECVLRRPGLEGAVLLLTSALSSVPAPFLYPLLSHALGGELLAYALLLPGSAVYVVLNACAARRDVPVEYAAAYGIRGLVYYAHVLLPASLPYLATGLLAAWGGAWNAIVIAEPLAGVHGIGSALVSAAEAGNMQLVSVLLLTMTTFVVVVNALVWKRIYNKAVLWLS
jgi:NitT/TauT family transport system permease protein